MDRICARHEDFTPAAPLATSSMFLVVLQKIKLFLEVLRGSICLRKVVAGKSSQSKILLVYYSPDVKPS